MPIQTSDVLRELSASAAEPVGPEETGGGECWKVTIDGEDFAAKFTTKDFETDRFGRAVEVLKLLDSDRIMKLSDTGTLQTADGELFPYILGEFIDGGNVRKKLESSGPPSEKDLKAFARGVFEGLAALGAEGVVHRDIKPENIMLRDGDWSKPVIVDFGYTRGMNMTTKTIYPWHGGTAPYMSPEQLRGEPARVRSDVWAGVVTVLEVASGNHPYAEVPDWQYADLILERLEKPPTIDPAVPGDVETWANEVNDFRGFKRLKAGEAIERMDDLWQ
ncbi:MAG: serine/threonine-protein kinase [Solirubrobacterales bacterium]